MKKMARILMNAFMLYRTHPKTVNLSSFKSYIFPFLLNKNLT